MDALIKNIKQKLSVDNLVEMMKDAKVIDNTHIKEEDVRRTLEKIDTDNLIDASELAEKLNEISELSKVNAEEKTHSTSKVELAKSTFGILTKPPEKEKKKTYDEIQDNITAFLD